MGNFLLSEIFGKVVTITVEQLGVEKDEVTPSASFTKDLGADSLDVVDLGMRIEEGFSITLLDKEMENIDDVESLVHLIQTKMN